MQVTRCFNPDTISEAAKLFGYQVAGFYPDQWVKDLNNIALVDENGNMALFEVENGTLASGHYLFKHKGQAGINSGLAIIAELFTNPCYNIKAIRGFTPEENRAAKLVSRKLGFKEVAVVDTVEGPCSLFVLTKEEWKKKHG